MFIVLLFNGNHALVLFELSHERITPAFLDSQSESRDRAGQSSNPSLMCSSSEKDKLPDLRLTYQATVAHLRSESATARTT